MEMKITFAMMKDEKARSILQADFAEMGEKALAELRWLRRQTDVDRMRAYETGELRKTKATDYLTREVKSPKAKYAMKRAVWEVLCNVAPEDASKGNPILVVETSIKEKGINTEIVQSAITSAFVALGVVWTGLGSALASESGKTIEEYVIDYAIIQLDNAYQRKLGDYCKFVPKQEPNP